MKGALFRIMFVKQLKNYNIKQNNNIYKSNYYSRSK